MGSSKARAMTGHKFEFLVDAQLPPALAKAITEAGHPARH
jgi:hypothetical protein